MKPEFKVQRVELSQCVAEWRVYIYSGWLAGWNLAGSFDTHQQAVTRVQQLAHFPRFSSPTYYDKHGREIPDDLS